ncbi:MAG: DNA repair protein RecO [Chitinispirillaceae bacterium]|nr:DNA repair protein RecO [Chitinispirillaceae bacterium]
MSIHKTSSIVLSTTPYRESSLIVTLFSVDYGRFQGIAKGIRSASKYSTPLERGMLIEHIVYVKKTREIQTLADIQVSDFFPEIRGNIEKTSVRDTAFELLISSLKPGDRNPELFSFVLDFLSFLSTPEITQNTLLFLLWSFHFRFASIMGFETNFSTCTHCSKTLVSTQSGGYLNHDQGGIVCNSCGKSHLGDDLFIPSELLSCQSFTDIPETFSSLLPSHQWLRLIRLASSYCRIHFDLKYPFRSLDFLEQVFK